jgi:hypothetical protein
MSMDRERVTLSASERQRFADLEAALSREDPHLHVALTEPASLSPATQLAVAAIVVVFGSGLVLATFTRWLWMALFGVALQVFGIRMCLDPIRRLQSRRRAAGKSPS